MSQNQIQEHVDLIVKHEQEFLAQRTLSERFGDSIAGFAGNLVFVGIHVLVFLTWIGVNTLPITHIHHFDPPPIIFWVPSLLLKRSSWRALFLCGSSVSAGARTSAII